MKLLTFVLLALTPDITGFWLLNREQSKPGGPMPVGNIWLRLVQQGNQLRQVMMSGGQTMSMTYTLDGEESSNTMHGMPYKSRLKWEGRSLLVDSVLGSPARHWILKENWTLSADGKRLTVVSTSTGPGSDGKPNTLVWDRQPPQKSAGETYKNVELLKELPASEITPLMESWNRSLGVACTHCHVQDKWEDESVKAKEVTRKMVRMTASISQTAQVSCWTCHRGSLPMFSPPGGMPSHDWPANTVTLTPEQEKLAAGEVFKNLRIMGPAPAGRVALAMNFFRASLGVECSHCHIPGEWEKDDKLAKTTARRMLNMVQSTQKEFSTSLSCFTCHRGAAKPEQSEPARP